MHKLDHMYEYFLIYEYYKDKKAKRSGVPYLNHIDEGLMILDKMNASEDAKRAFCIHPILQDDITLEENIPLVKGCALNVVILCMEYRNVANRGLQCFQVDDPAHIYLGPLKEVRDMLIADKVQNRKDFLKYHLKTHPKSKELDIYFKNWLRALGVTERIYEDLIKDII